MKSATARPPPPPRCRSARHSGGSGGLGFLDALDFLALGLGIRNFLQQDGHDLFVDVQVVVELAADEIVDITAHGGTFVQ